MPSKKRATPISLQPLDALFGTNEETNNGICEIEIGSLHALSVWGLPGGWYVFG